MPGLTPEGVNLDQIKKDGDWLARACPWLAILAIIATLIFAKGVWDLVTIWNEIGEQVRTNPVYQEEPPYYDVREEVLWR